MSQKTKILITGANGYLGNCLYNFLKKNYNVQGIDIKNNINNKIFKCNILNSKKFDNFLKEIKPEIIIHLAAQSLVDETINKQKYFKNNVLATKVLLKLMRKNKIKNIIFSSTASVYKKSNKPLTENSLLKPLSYYAKTKLNAENLIKKNKNIKNIILRFFNVCSALNKPIIGELHNPETHLIPTVTYKSLKKKKIYIYGKNFKTIDGTCVRDYIHIIDVCHAITKSIQFLLRNKKSLVLNIGNSRGYSNYEVIKHVEKILKRKSKIKFVGSRKGDVAKLICNSKKAKSFISWRANNSNINKIIENEFNWIKKLDKIGIKRSFKNYI
tara:strand:- start:396 stop:1376 length:981 start_codon:yes stop_codon:yes gene_type:complete